MTNHKLKALLSLLFICSLQSASAQKEFKKIESIQKKLTKSHIQGNVPKKHHFDSYLKRDLESFFSAEAGSPAKVNYEFLREPPTQVGVAYPKFYLWVNIFIAGKLEKSGAVRVAAVEKETFKITHFIDAREIKSVPDSITQVFPEVLCPLIREKAATANGAESAK